MNSKRPGRFLRFFFRIPVVLYRLGITGWERWIGAQWMLITTIGRKTGKRRHTMVDVLLHEEQSDTYYILAAYGQRSDWVRNLQAMRSFRAQVGRRKFEARYQTLSGRQAGEMLVRFHSEKPAYTRAVMNAAGMKFKDEKELQTIGGNLLLLAVTPTG